jgi:inosine-uridine nucleoside N-ribohydrolase
LSTIDSPYYLPVLIDTDTGIDDAVAIALAARLDVLRVVAITTVHGNIEVERATRNARLVARGAGLEVPVIAGAAKPLTRPARPARETHGEEGLGWVHPPEPPVHEPDRAGETIVRLAREVPGLALCCLGPLTNLAHALEREPLLRERLGPVFIMGGALAVPGTQTRWSEFNWWADPEAADVVLRAGLDVRLVPLDVTRRIAVPGSAIDALRAAGERDPSARFWADALRFYADFHRSHELFDGCVINDALAVALVAEPALATWAEMHIGVALGEDHHRGAIVKNVADGPLVRAAIDVRAGDVLTLIERELFARWLAPGALIPGAAAAERWLRINALEAEQQP